MPGGLSAIGCSDGGVELKAGAIVCGNTQPDGSPDDCTGIISGAGTCPSAGTCPL
jgi:hypothetical protein